MKLKNKTKQDRVSGIFEKIFLFCAVISIISVVVISLYMIISGFPAVKEIGLFNFLFGTVWNPTGANPSYGILPMILSSICATFGAIIIGVPIGVLTAVFLSEIANKKVANFIRPFIEILSGIPSVIYGFVGLILLVPFIAKVFDLSYGANLFTGMLVLSIMILPTIVTISENSIRSLPSEYKEASLGLGATKMQTIFKILIPAARSGITTSIVLGIGRAIGETMAVIMVTGNSVNMPDIFQSVRLMTSGIVSEMSYAVGLHKDALFAIGLVLFIFIMIINLILNVFLAKADQKYD
ncbi:phosphate ABC transporter permease subunit PstC [Anaerofustis stercorihominis]|uniref:Phosphate transport system permease protein n=1 Tax=Anaerofustis stercorihominis DSM 17244 TaxID=445971 RepID=B1C9A0_9FIRM|nr:phosphate ABC transporter permease subunit PstC [Anaerofustis stercorihominis]EDS72264.1 phosphate ABC transporter, permease protein PstC [Anaerofustis stercorihominis DSM 17244]MCQ4795137.1 phosphate ABC transporter permease subunit PstC [Anaerofustis stercorihominis]